MLVILCTTNMLMTGCEKERVMVDGNTAIGEVDVIKIKDKKILFTHASVGNNIIQGIEEILHGIPAGESLTIRKISEEITVEEPGLYHAIVGRNGYPEKKIAGFRDLVEKQALSGSLDVAFMKLCYVDIEADTDVTKIFSLYEDTVEYLQGRYPDLTLVHVTTPLYAHGYRLKSRIKSLLLGDVSNVKRNLYNQMIREKYGKEDFIYDLAELESTNPDGSRVTFRYKGGTYYSLSKLYTDDGGHLNKTGRRLAAAELVRVLSTIE